MRRVSLAFALVALTGCISTAKTIVTAPFNVAGKAVDWTTTSQSEADRNRGRTLRKAEARARRACRHEADAAFAACVRDRLDDRTR